MKKETIAVATKTGRKTKELKTWEQVSEYQTRGWDITMKNNKEGNKMKKMNGHEKIAAKNIQGAFNWLVGGWYNCYQDGYEEDIPTLEEAKEEVYYAAMNNLYRGGSESCEKAPKEMRFAGEEFCRAYVEKLFKTDIDAQELWGGNNIIDAYHNKTKKTQEGKEMKQVTREEARAQVVKNYTVKEMREVLKEAGFKGISRAKKDELVEMMLDWAEKQDASRGNTIEVSKVKMYAFTGMYIGEFDAEVKDGKILVYTESKGELMFDLNTGKEITDEAKARYANKVERA